MVIADELAMSELASDLCASWRAGDTILLSGPLGAGKTTFARAILHALGWQGPVRSPTFTLLHVYETQPPVAHADLYRVKGAEGIGLEEYLDTHLCLIEWPDRLGAMVDPARCWQIDIQFAPGEDEGRRAVTVTPPSVLG
jgi:tRNA threonylcarbamoyladenosine biosynthesis protein TsaE